MIREMVRSAWSRAEGKTQGAAPATAEAFCSAICRFFDPSSTVIRSRMARRGHDLPGGGATAEAIDFTDNIAGMQCCGRGDWSKSRFVLAGGQSGNPLSPHRTDLFDSGSVVTACRWRDRGRGTGGAADVRADFGGSRELAATHHYAETVFW